MKHIKILTACLVLLAGLAYTASGATNGVVLGQSFQSVIDASAPGDTLVVQPGIYPDASLVFNKPLTVLPSGTNGDMMRFLGAIQVTGAGASSFQRAFFGGSVQTTGATVSFYGSYFNGTVQTTGAAVSFFDSTFNGNVTVTGSSVTMKRTTLNYPLTLSGNAAMVALRMTNNATVTATATVGLNTPFLAVQSQFFNTVTLSGYTAWLGYNNFNVTQSYPPSNLRETNCNSVLIGNKFLSQATSSSGANAIYVSGGTLKAYNNLITDNALCGINLNSAAAEIANNTLLCIAGTGIQANGGGPMVVRGDIILLAYYWNGYVDVQGTGAASQALFVSYCDLWNAAAGSGNPTCLGVTPPLVSCLIQVNPNLAAEDYAADGSLNAGSPCINAGPPDAIYNNRDGTRNTMGYTGGPYYNPANYTNDNPMVFFLWPGQQVVLSGIQTNIWVSAAASAGH
jgi:hypothetical protein